MQAVLAIDEGALFVLEGTGQADRVPGMAWGNGFITNQTIIQAYNLSDPTGFFEDLSAIPDLASKTILSPHVYGPLITVRGHSTLATGFALSDVLCDGQRSLPDSMRMPLPQHAHCLCVKSALHVQEWGDGIRLPKFHPYAAVQHRMDLVLKHDNALPCPRGRVWC